MNSLCICSELFLCKKNYSLTTLRVGNLKFKI